MLGGRCREGRAAHWLLLVLGDRVDAIGSHAVSFASRWMEIDASDDVVFTKCMSSTGGMSG